MSLGLTFLWNQLTAVFYYSTCTDLKKDKLHLLDLYSFCYSLIVMIGSHLYKSSIRRPFGQFLMRCTFVNLDPFVKFLSRVMLVQNMYIYMINICCYPLYTPQPLISKSSNSDKDDFHHSITNGLRFCLYFGDFFFKVRPLALSCDVWLGRYDTPALKTLYNSDRMIRYSVFILCALPYGTL